MICRRKIILIFCSIWSTLTLIWIWTNDDHNIVIGACSDIESPSDEISSFEKSIKGGAGIKFHNKFWQRLNHSDTTIYLWNAHLDKRSLPDGAPSHIRIIAMSYTNDLPPIQCNIIFEDETRHLVEANVISVWRHVWGNETYQVLRTVLITCPIIGSKIPRLVSLSFSDTRDSVNDTIHSIDSNILSIIDESIDNKSKFAICFKWMDFYDQDLSVRLIEWLEMVKILGASHIFLNILSTHPSIRRVIKYYESIGFVTLTEYTLPGDQPNDPKKRHLYLYENIREKRRHEQLPLYDCMYRAINNYEYLGIFDMDEMIVPNKHNNWNELFSYVESMKNDSIDYFSFRRYYFLDNDTNYEDRLIKNIPSYSHILRHVYRTDDHYSKSFFKLDKTVSMNNLFC